MIQKRLIGSVLAAVMALNATVVSPVLYFNAQAKKKTPSAKSESRKAAPVKPKLLDATASNHTSRAVQKQEKPKPLANTNPSNNRRSTQYHQLPANQFDMLARIIHAEAGGESLKGQVAVAAVILNRIRSGRFPETVTGNVFKPGEFESVSNGYIWAQPNAESYRAANLAVKGWDPTNGALYFFNPAKSSSRWIWTRNVVIVIGEHHFAV